ncbi:3-hydroxybutyryl-CoA dehydrogenase 2 [Stagonosporopsis vannaccii]|nr:3-hydroxybutyryl-CoA dehydrogenase 2 [Stagonosporopsis vannaccii]
MSWQPPKDYQKRPVAILGAGVLGRRIACTWAAGGYEVQVRDPSTDQRAQCLQYVDENITTYKNLTKATKAGRVQVFEDLEHAVANAWLVIEAVPEKLELKISTFATLEQLAPKDCILATNSSSYKSSEMIAKITDYTKRRVLNTHYYMPPENMVVELMTDGLTEGEIFPFLSERFRESGAKPYVARKESTGFIFNRLWAAVKRETLTILSEGVSDAEEIDSLWTEMFVKGGARPCKTMDQVGLDTVAFIESHYIAERGLSSTHTTDFLKANYLDQGKLGNKSDKGGLYAPKRKEAIIHGPTNGHTADETSTLDPTILVLDTGLSASDPNNGAGAILQLSAGGSAPKPIITGQELPDGIAIDRSLQRMFWSCMGIPASPDGAVYSANLDGSDQRTVIVPGKINTPKQLTLDTAAQKLYFCDREGCTVYRCSYDGSNLEVLVQNGGTLSNNAGQANAMNWCVGIAVSPAHGKFYWSQKGPSKGGRGRIFCASIATPEGKTAATREDIKCILYGLPEPIDLEVDEEHGRLYWTDRGELPWGNSLSRVDLDSEGLPVLEEPTVMPSKLVIARRFHEAIGLQIDAERNSVYVSDLGGGVYVCDLDGRKRRTIFQDEKRAFTGLALL